MKTPRPASNDLNRLITQVQQLLDTSQAQAALELLNATKQDTPAVRNARGVCLLRLQRFDAALHVFRELVFPAGVLAIPRQTPTLWRVNYVTTLLLLDDVITASAVLYRIPDRQHPDVRQLNQALRAWKQSLPLWRRALLYVGVYPRNSLRLDFAPGRLWLAEPESSDSDGRGAT